MYMQNAQMLIYLTKFNLSYDLNKILSYVNIMFNICDVQIEIMTISFMIIFKNNQTLSMLHSIVIVRLNVKNDICYVHNECMLNDRKLKNAMNVEERTRLNDRFAFIFCLYFS